MNIFRLSTQDSPAEADRDSSVPGRGATLRPFNLRQTFVLANAFKEGDRPSAAATMPADSRRGAALARRTAPGRHRSGAFVDDGVSEALERSLDVPSLGAVSGLTVGG